MIVAGRAEIYEASACANFGAYRPIRVLRPGDTFGHFSLSDQIVGLTNTAHSKEVWRITAGHVSTLLAYRLAGDKEPTRYPESLGRYLLAKHRQSSGTAGPPPTAADERDPFAKAFFPHMILRRYEVPPEVGAQIIPAPEPTLVAHIVFESMESLERNVELSQMVLRGALRATAPYRLCRNIYSDTFYWDLERRVDVFDVPIEYKRVDQGHRYELFPHFLGAVTQALDAYLHDDPMFYAGAWDWPDQIEWSDGHERIVRASDLWSVDHPSRRPDAEAIYPISLTNFHLNRKVAASVETSKFWPTKGGPFLFPEKRDTPPGFKLYTYYAEVIVRAYFDLFGEVVRAHDGPDLPHTLDELRPRVSVDSDYWGVNGRRTLMLKFAPKAAR